LLGIVIQDLGIVNLRRVAGGASVDYETPNDWVIVSRFG
jgi:hypothetical protein